MISPDRTSFARHAGAARFTSRASFDGCETGRQFLHDLASYLGRHGQPGADLIARASAAEAIARFHVN
jgi:hypothetical protein